MNTSSTTWGTVLACIALMGATWWIGRVPSDHPDYPVDDDQDVQALISAIQTSWKEGDRKRVLALSEAALALDATHPDLQSLQSRLPLLRRAAEQAKQESRWDYQSSAAEGWGAVFKAYGRFGPEDSEEARLDNTWWLSIQQASSPAYRGVFLKEPQRPEACGQGTNPWVARSINDSGEQVFFRLEPLPGQPGWWRFTDRAAVSAWLALGTAQWSCLERPEVHWTMGGEGYRADAMGGWTLQDLGHQAAPR